MDRVDGWMDSVVRKMLAVACLPFPTIILARFLKRLTPFPFTRRLIKYTFTMTTENPLEIDYGTMFAVMDSWEALRRMKDSDEVAGVILFKQ